MTLTDNVDFYLLFPFSSLTGRLHISSQNKGQIHVSASVLCTVRVVSVAFFFFLLFFGGEDDWV